MCRRYQRELSEPQPLWNTNPRFQTGSAYIYTGCLDDHPATEEDLRDAHSFNRFFDFATRTESLRGDLDAP